MLVFIYFFVRSYIDNIVFNAFYIEKKIIYNKSIPKFTYSKERSIFRRMTAMHKVKQRYNQNDNNKRNRFYPYIILK